ncbi:MAG: LVIVD repeat-containing protein [Actinomycetota bacterium]
MVIEYIEMRTRRSVSMSIIALGFLAGAIPASSAPSIQGPGPGYFASDNVEWLGVLPLNTDSAGARLVGKYFYITSSNSLRIFDVAKPESPQQVGILPLPQSPQFAEEDVDTNGRVLLVSTLGNLYVIDVEDKTNPAIIGELSGVDEHTFSCVLDCTFAYGSEGAIVDIRDPASPKVVGDWAKGSPAQSFHDVTEIKPGIIVTSTQPLLLLDARKTPAKPLVKAQGGNADNRFIHSNLWPRRGKERFLLVGGESGPGRCGEGDGAPFMTWDMSKVGKTKTFTMADEYYVTDGLPTDGNMPVHSFCTHWFEPHPSYKSGGLVAMGWYEHGTRFLRVSKNGEITEDGYFLPTGGSTSADYWINDEIVYAVDYQRGIDILRYTDKP